MTTSSQPASADEKSVVIGAGDPLQYALGLPDASYIKDGLSYAIEQWRPRNQLFAKWRSYLNGTNEIEFPPATQYKIKVTRTFLFAQIVNEKAARFLSHPEIAAVVENPAQITSERSWTTQLERGINGIQYWAEIQGDGDVWSRMVHDAVAFDMGVERVEFMQGAMWPELTIVQDTKTHELREKLSYLRPFENPDDYRKYREEYKKEAGVPFRNVYVYPEAFLPIFEGPTVVESFELEQRALRQVIANPLFETAALRSYCEKNQYKPFDYLKKQVTLVHYSNQNMHSYWALLPTGESDTKWPEGKDPSDAGVGRPVLLHYYQHGLGRPIYNIMAGRFGGWKTNHNRIESINNALCQLNQDADEVMSQVLTNVRATNWPTLVAYFDPEYRDATEGKQAPPTIKEGENVSMWKGEELRPLFQPQQNPMVQWFMENLMRTAERLAGGAALFGQHQPGVDTGYQSNLQITQAEHLDEKLEQHIAQAAIQRAMLYLRYIAEVDEKVWVNYQTTNAQGHRRGLFVELDPKRLKPLPQLDARVRRPRSIDYTIALRAALDASADRNGRGPLLDDDTIRERILGEEAPDMIERKIIIQNQKHALLQSEVLAKRVMERLNLLLVEQSAQPASPEQIAAAPPALLQTLSAQNFQPGGPAAGAGGVPMEDLANQAEGGMMAGQTMFPHEPPPPGPGNVRGMGTQTRMGTGGGTPGGTGQPEQVIGRAIQTAVRSGAM